MIEYFPESTCKELESKYYRLVTLIELVIGLTQEIRRLKNHPINDFPELIYLVLPYWWEAKGVQSHLLEVIFDFLNDFKSTRNKNLKKVLPEIESLAYDILSYDSMP